MEWKGVRADDGIAKLKETGVYHAAKRDGLRDIQEGLHPAFQGSWTVGWGRTAFSLTGNTREGEGRIGNLDKLFLQKEDGTMSGDKEYEVEDLERIFAGATLSPVFRHNPKYPIERGVARIAYNDIMDYKFIIRHDKNFKGNSFWSEDADVIAEYKSIEELVGDGWRLD